MLPAEFSIRFSGHPLETSINAMADAGEWRDIHVYYIAAKTTIHLLKYQGDITSCEEVALQNHIHAIVDQKLGRKRNPC